MIITLDDRTGQEGLADLLSGSVTVRVERMPFADAAFDGHGPKGVVTVGVEIKKLADILGCHNDDRFAGHQLPGLVSTYDFRYLLIEGDWYRGSHGEIRERKKRGPLYSSDQPARTNLTYREFKRWLHTHRMFAGLHIEYAVDRAETAATLIDLAGWWDKPWARHSSHLAFEPRLGLNDTQLVYRPTFPRDVAKEIPGVGWEKSKAVIARFPTVEAMVEASEEAWRGVPGIGKTMAARIFRIWRER